jgi:hypothetical protein
VGGSGVIERGGHDLAVNGSAGWGVKLGLIGRGVVEGIKVVIVFALAVAIALVYPFICRKEDVVIRVDVVVVLGVGLEASTRLGPLLGRVTGWPAALLSAHKALLVMLCVVATTSAIVVAALESILAVIAETVMTRVWVAAFVVAIVTGVSVVAAVGIEGAVVSWWR